MCFSHYLYSIPNKQTNKQPTNHTRQTSSKSSKRENPFPEPAQAEARVCCLQGCPARGQGPGCSSLKCRLLPTQPSNGIVIAESRDAGVTLGDWGIKAAPSQQEKQAPVGGILPSPSARRKSNCAGSCPNFTPSQPGPWPFTFPPHIPRLGGKGKQVGADGVRKAPSCRAVGIEGRSQRSGEAPPRRGWSGGGQTHSPIKPYCRLSTFCPQMVSYKNKLHLPMLA